MLLASIFNTFLMYSRNYLYPPSLNTLYLRFKVVILRPGRSFLIALVSTTHERLVRMVKYNCLDNFSYQVGVASMYI